MQQTAMQNQFFIGKNELQDNIFSQDLKIADFWQKTDDKRKNEIIKEPLQQIVKDLQKDYNENYKSFENIYECEEDVDEMHSSSRTKSDFDQHEYEEAMDMLKSKFDVDKEISSVGGKDESNSKIKLTPLPTEYTEFNGQQMITTTGTPYSVFPPKQRRGRKDRKAGAKSNTGTTSSSGLNAGSTTINTSIYDYNSNQLTAQYGNSAMGRQADADDLELGMGQNQYSINNYNLSDQEDLDPENLLPFTHFSNDSKGLDQYYN